MSAKSGTTLVGQLIDERSVFSAEETLKVCSISTEILVSLVSEGVVEPLGGEPASWRFDAAAVARAMKAVRLHRELEIDMAAVALVLDLLQEIETLQRRLDGSMD